MASKNITIRLEEVQAENLKRDYGQISTAIQLIVEPFERIRRMTIDELKGYFTREEWVALIDSQNAVLLSPDFIYSRNFLLAQLEDFESLERGVSRHRADSKTILNKIRQLSHSQVYFLVMEINAFWNTGKELSLFLEEIS